MFHKFDPPTLTLGVLHPQHLGRHREPPVPLGRRQEPARRAGAGDRAGRQTIQGALFQWFKDTHDKGRSDPDTKKDCKIYRLNRRLDGSILKAWSFQKTSILSYSSSGVNANSNALLTGVGPAALRGHRHPVVSR